MNEINLSCTSDVKIAYITEEDLKKTYKYPILTINVANSENVKLLQIPDNKLSAIKQPVNILNLVKPKSSDDINILKRKNQIEYRILRPEDLKLKVPTTENTHIPVKHSKSKKTLIEIEKEENEVPRKVFRTRSGRMSKPPKYMQDKDYSQESINTRDKSEIISSEINIQVLKKDTSNKTENKRNISSQFRCNTCKKAYLGKNKMMKHLRLNPGHTGPDFNSYTKLNIWSELLQKTNEVSKNEQSKLVCKELINIIFKARTVIPKLIKPASKEENADLSVDSVISNVLGIPIGNYSFNDNISLTEIVNSDSTDNKNNSEIKEQEKCADNDSESSGQNNYQNSLLNLLDTGQVTFDSSTSEEVMNVDQLVNERLKSLTGGELEPTNNVIQNLNLDLSLDMFYHSS